MIDENKVGLTDENAASFQARQTQDDERPAIFDAALAYLVMDYLRRSEQRLGNTLQENLNKGSSENPSEQRG